MTSSVLQYIDVDLNLFWNTFLGFDQQTVKFSNRLLGKWQLTLQIPSSLSLSFWKSLSFSGKTTFYLVLPSSILFQKTSWLINFSETTMSFLFALNFSTFFLFGAVHFLLRKSFYSFLSIPDFGVSTAILNTADISRSWCKLNFGPLRGHVKSCHFPE